MTNSPVQLVPPLSRDNGHPPKNFSPAPQGVLESLQNTVAPRRRVNTWPGRMRWLVFLLTLAALGWYGRQIFTGKQRRSDPIVAKVVRADLPILVTERGELESSVSIIGRCEVEGERVKITKILPEGTIVKKGQDVVWLDSEPFSKEFAKQEITWKQAEGKAKAAKGDLEVARNKAETDIDGKLLVFKLAKLTVRKYLEGDLAVEIADKKGAIELARKELNEAEADLTLTRTMVTKGLRQMDELNRQKLQLDTKKYALTSSENKLMVLEKFDQEYKTTELEAKSRDAERDWERTKKSSAASIEKAGSDLEAAESTMSLEKQTLDRIAEQLKKCVMKAPGDGIMIYFRYSQWDDSRIQAGAQLFPQQQIFTLPDLNKMQVKLQLHESVIKKIRSDQIATITVDAFPNMVLRGKVRTVATLAQSQWRSNVKNYQTEIDIVDLPPEMGIKPGMTADVKILIQTLKDVLIVPVQSVSEREGKHYAYVVSDGEVRNREVKVGESTEKYIQILEGLDEGETVAQDARSRVAAEAKKAEEEKKKPTADKAVEAKPAEGKKEEPLPKVPEKS